MRGTGLGSRSAAGAIVAAALTACVGCRRSFPQISHRQTRVADVTPDGMRLLFDLEAVNPGRYPCVLTECRYRLKVAGRQYIRGRRDENLILPTGRRVAWSLPIDVDMKELLQRVGDIGRGTRVPFALDLDCTCRPESGLDRWSVWFDTTGEIPLPAPPTADVQRVTVTQLTDQQASVVADLVVQNANDEPLTLLAMQYELKLAGYEMGTGTVSGPTTIPPGGSVRVRLGGSRAVMGVEFGLGRRLSRDQVSYEVRGHARVQVTLQMPWSFTVSGTAPLVRPSHR